MPDKQLLCCGVITPTETRTSRVTENGWVVHTRDTVAHTVHTPKPRLLERAIKVAFWILAVCYVGITLAIMERAL